MWYLSFYHIVNLLTAKSANSNKSIGYLPVTQLLRFRKKLFIDLSIVCIVGKLFENLHKLMFGSAVYQLGYVFDCLLILLSPTFEAFAERSHCMPGVVNVHTIKYFPLLQSLDCTAHCYLFISYNSLRGSIMEPKQKIEHSVEICKCLLTHNNNTCE
jgi:hypothetical protein